MLFDFIEKKYLQVITCILLLKDFSVENLETTSRSIYLELLIIGLVF